MEQEFDFESRIVSSEYSPSDSDAEVSLRPKTLAEYIGQEKAKENLKIGIEAAKLRGESLDHRVAGVGDVWHLARGNLAAHGAVEHLRQTISRVV